MITRKNTNLRNNGKKIRQIAVDVDKEVLAKFRETIYHKTGLKKGDFKAAIEHAMLDYILKYSKSKDSIDFVKYMKEKG
ncbi:MAG: hypothetical protein FJ360_02185 [Thaumarchaeota archaeon]|nr:hypothetical protein [Nitrososphaerota archaeon]